MIEYAKTLTNLRVVEQPSASEVGNEILYRAVKDTLANLGLTADFASRAAARVVLSYNKRTR